MNAYQAIRLLENEKFSTIKISKKPDGQFLCWSDVHFGYGKNVPILLEAVRLIERPEINKGKKIKIVFIKSKDANRPAITITEKIEFWKHYLNAQGLKLFFKFLLQKLTF